MYLPSNSTAAHVFPRLGFSKKEDITKLYHHFHGLRPSEIQRQLAEPERITTSKCGITQFIHRYLETGTITWHPGSGGQLKITEDEENSRVSHEKGKCDDGEPATHNSEQARVLP
jgi:hypothetical protein